MTKIQVLKIAVLFLLLFSNPAAALLKETQALELLKPEGVEILKVSRIEVHKIEILLFYESVNAVIKFMRAVDQHELFESANLDKSSGSKPFGRDNYNTQKITVTLTEYEEKYNQSLQQSADAPFE